LVPGAQITERDAVISDNYNTLQALRRRCQELETHKFVLGYKVCVCIEREYGACEEDLGGRPLAIAGCSDMHSETSHQA
jgi:hypothetical protein